MHKKRANTTKESRDFRKFNKTTENLKYYEKLTFANLNNLDRVNYPILFYLFEIQKTSYILIPCTLQV